MKLIFLISLVLASALARAGDWNCDGVRIRKNRVIEGGDPALRVLGTWPSPNNAGEELVMLGYRGEKVIAVQACYPADGRN